MSSNLSDVFNNKDLVINPHVLRPLHTLHHLQINIGSPYQVCHDMSFFREEGKIEITHTQ